MFEVQNLVKDFPIGRSWVRKSSKTIKAINNISFDIVEGETFGLVGESGCGKSTVARLLTRLIEPSSGSGLFRGMNIAGLSNQGFNEKRRHSLASGRTKA